MLFFFFLPLKKPGTTLSSITGLDCMPCRQPVLPTAPSQGAPVDITQCALQVPLSAWRQLTSAEAQVRTAWLAVTGNHAPDSLQHPLLPSVSPFQLSHTQIVSAVFPSVSISHPAAKNGSLHLWHQLIEPSAISLGIGDFGCWWVNAAGLDVGGLGAGGLRLDVARFRYGGPGPSHFGFSMIGPEPTRPCLLDLNYGPCYTIPRPPRLTPPGPKSPFQVGSRSMWGQGLGFRELWG